MINFGEFLALVMLVTCCVYWYGKGWRAIITSPHELLAVFVSLLFMLSLLYYARESRISEQETEYTEQR